LNNTRKRIVIFNVFGHGNSGDAVLLETLVQVLIEVWPDGELRGVAFDPVSQQRWMPNVEWAERVGNAQRGSTAARLLQILFLLIALLISCSRIFLFLRFLLPQKQQKALEMFQQADYAISCPGGYLEDSNAAYLINVLGVLLAHRLSKQVILAPQSVGPVSSGLGRWAIRKALLASDRIFVRELKAQQFVNELLDTPQYRDALKKVELAGDMAFWFAPEHDSPVVSENDKLVIGNDRKLFGLTVVDWGFPHVPDPAAAKKNYVDSISTLIRHVEAKGDYNIAIFNQVAHDLELGKAIGRLHPNVIVDVWERDAVSFLNLISRCDVFIGTRFHSCIFALLGNVPTAAIAYLPKTSGLMHDLDLSDLVVGIDTVTGQQLIALFERLLSERDVLRQRIAENLERYRHANGRFIEYLKRESLESHAKTVAEVTN